MPQESFSILYAGMLPPHPGGSGISWAQLLGGFAARGHRVRSLAPITMEALADGDPFAESHPELGVHRFVVPHFYTGPNVPAHDDYLALESREIRKELGTLIAAEKPDVLISGRESFGLHVPAIAVAGGIPCLQGIRGNTTVAILNGSYPRAHTERLLGEFRKADLLVSAARHMAEGLERFGFTNIEVIPNAVDLGQFSGVPRDEGLVRQLQLEERDIVVMHLSNLKTVKRPMDLIPSAELALRKVPRLCYVVVGDGAFRGPMEQECRRRQLMPRFRFVGWIEHARVPAHLVLSDLVVSMSASEGLSRVYLEAQASGRLLVASDIAPAREVIEDGVSGLLFRKGDVEDLAEKTVRVARDPELRSRIARKGRERVAANSLDAAVERYLAVFGACIRKHQGARGRH
ncbi:MAG: glycosyltransferase family 4 protein [Acidobacteriota bacterium]